MKLFLLTMSFLLSYTGIAHARVKCSKGVEMLHVHSKYAVAGLPYYDEESLDIDYRYCRVLAHYFECKKRKRITPEHYRVINYFTGYEVLVPQNTKTYYVFDKKEYNNIDSCEVAIVKHVTTIIEERNEYDTTGNIGTIKSTGL